MKIIIVLLLLVSVSIPSYAVPESKFVFDGGFGLGFLDKEHAENNLYSNNGIFVDFHGFYQFSFARVGAYYSGGSVKDENDFTHSTTNLNGSEPRESKVSMNYSFSGLSIGGSYTFKDLVTVNLDLIKSKTSLYWRSECINCDSVFFEKKQSGFMISPSIVYLAPAQRGSNLRFGLYLQQIINLDPDSKFKGGTSFGITMIL